MRTDIRTANELSKLDVKLRTGHGIISMPRYMVRLAAAAVCRFGGLIGMQVMGTEDPPDAMMLIGVDFFDKELLGWTLTALSRENVPAGPREKMALAYYALDVALRDPDVPGGVKVGLVQAYRGIKLYLDNVPTGTD